MLSLLLSPPISTQITDDKNIQKMDDDIAVLADLNVPRDVFYLSDAFNEEFLQDPNVFQIFDENRSEITTLIKNANTLNFKNLVSKFQELYYQAYHYDVSTQKMALGEDSNSQFAKHKLDLWTGLMDYLTVSDPIMMIKVLSGPPELRKFESLNGEQLEASDRAFFYQFELGAKNFSDFHDLYYQNVFSGRFQNPSFIDLEDVIYELIPYEELKQVFEEGIEPSKVDVLLDQYDPDRKVWDVINKMTQEDQVICVIDLLEGETEATIEKYSDLITSKYFLPLALLNFDLSGHPFNAALVETIIDQEFRDHNLSSSEAIKKFGDLPSMKRGHLNWPQTGIHLYTSNHLDNYKWLYLDYLFRKGDLQPTEVPNK